MARKDTDMKKSLLAVVVGMLAVSGCSLIPDYQRPNAPVENAWPHGQAYDALTVNRDQQAADIGWRDFYRDPALQRLIQLSLDNNRDLRQADRKSVV